MNKVTPEQMDMVEACKHEWVTSTWRRECRHCGIGEQIMSMQAASEMVPTTTPRSKVNYSAETLRTIADEMDTLEFMYDELKRRVISVLGSSQCICGFGTGRPGTDGHNLKCRELRAAVGIGS